MVTAVCCTSECWRGRPELSFVMCQQKEKRAEHVSELKDVFVCLWPLVGEEKGSDCLQGL